MKEDLDELKEMVSIVMLLNINFDNFIYNLEKIICQILKIDLSKKDFSLKEEDMLVNSAKIFEMYEYLERSIEYNTALKSNRPQIIKIINKWLINHPKVHDFLRYSKKTIPLLKDIIGPLGELLSLLE